MEDASLEGSNMLVLCQADMNKALEWYLNNVLLKVPVKVVAIKQANNTQYDGFEVRIAPREET